MAYILQQSQAALFKTGLTLTLDKTKVLEAYQPDTAILMHSNSHSEHHVGDLATSDWVHANYPQPSLNMVHQRLKRRELLSSVGAMKSAIKVAGVPIGRDEAAQELIEDAIRKH
mgnify:CR=1 FL=1